MRIIINFKNLKITVGECVDKEMKKNPDYRKYIDSKRVDIEHVNILKLVLQDLDCEVNMGKK